jgi:hypothetical protein
MKMYMLNGVHIVLEWTHVDKKEMKM